MLNIQLLIKWMTEYGSRASYLVHLEYMFVFSAHSIVSGSISMKIVEVRRMLKMGLNAMRVLVCTQHRVPLSLFNFRFKWEIHLKRGWRAKLLLLLISLIHLFMAFDFGHCLLIISTYRQIYSACHRQCCTTRVNLCREPYQKRAEYVLFFGWFLKGKEKVLT